MMETATGDLNNNNNKDLVEKVRQRRLFILEQGNLAKGISPNNDPKQPPPWFEKESFKLAQELFKINRVIIRLSQFLGLNLVLYHTHGLEPLLFTGNSRSVSKLFARYLSTMIHITHWFEHDPFDSGSKAYRSLNIVRGLHRQVSTQMNQGQGLEEDGHAKLWIPQYGMCHAQFSFVGLMAVFPKELGFHNFTQKDKHALFHFWRVIGYCLGTDDQFNLCSGTDEETVELCKQIYFEEWLPVIKVGEEKVGIEMGKAITLAMGHVSPMLHYNPLMRYCAPFLQLDMENYPLEYAYEKFIYFWFNMYYNTMSKSKIFNRLLSILNELRIRHAISKKDALEQELSEKYPEPTFENRCPFHAQINYKNAIEHFYHKSK